MSNPSTQTNDLSASPKRSEKATSEKKRTRASRSGKSSMPDNPVIKVTKTEEEPIVSPGEILKQAAMRDHRAIAGIATSFDDDDAISNEYGNTMDGEKKINKVLSNEFADDIRNKNGITLEDPIHIPDNFVPLDEIPNEYKIRKIAIKKIPRFNFRLGMEKVQNEKLMLIPGVGHTWAPGKKGDEFITGLDDIPEVRARLEKELRVKLDNKSSYWATLTFRMEDKEHGQIINFDDTRLGAYYETVYYAMLVDPIIANGLQEYKSGKKPAAEWYIENKEAEAELRQEDMNKEEEAFNTFSDLGHTKRKEIAENLGLNVWGAAPKVASMELWDYIKSNTENAKEFLKQAALDPTTFSVTHLVKTAIKFNVLRRNKFQEIMFANESIGATEEQVINKLKLATNAQLRNAISTQVTAKLR